MNMKDLFQHIGGHFSGTIRNFQMKSLRDSFACWKMCGWRKCLVSRSLPLDEYVEKQVQGENAARLMPLLREHFDLCPDCCEEYEALLNVLEKSAAETRPDEPDHPNSGT